MKILLTGKDGQVGFELRRSLAPLGDVQALGAIDCNLCDEPAIRHLVRAYQPNVIVNAAAYTAVDKAEEEEALAHAVNTRAPIVLAEEAQILGAMLVHYSTDYVFDGEKGSAYTEADLANPQSVYGATKLAGERGVAHACARHVILRTSWVVGAHGSNFAKTMLRLASERSALDVVEDQWGAPTSAELLADVTAHLVRQATQHKVFPYGLYHLSAAGETNWYAYAKYVINRAREVGQPMRLMPDRLRAIKAADYPTTAKRPANSRLDTTKLAQTFGLHLPNWQIGVDHILDQIFEGRS